MKTMHQADKNDVLFMIIFMSKLPELLHADEVLAEHASAASHAPVTLMHMDQSGSNKGSPAATATALQPKTDSLCRYHRRWGADAHRCLKPCTWTGTAPASQ